MDLQFIITCIDSQAQTRKHIKGRSMDADFAGSKDTLHKIIETEQFLEHLTGHRWHISCKEVKIVPVEPSRPQGTDSLPNLLAVKKTAGTILMERVMKDCASMEKITKDEDWPNIGGCDKEPAPKKR